MATSTHVRCTLCSTILPSWLPLPDVPNSALLLHHLADLHPLELKPLLQRMATEEIGTVAMEAFVRVKEP